MRHNGVCELLLLLLIFNMFIIIIITIFIVLNTPREGAAGELYDDRGQPEGRRFQLESRPAAQN